MEPVINGGVNVPTNVQQLNTAKKAKIAFKQDLQMQPELQQDQFSTMPMVYEPDVEPPKKSSGFGSLLLGAAAIAATVMAVVKHRQVSGLKGEVEAATKVAQEATAKAAEAESKLQGLETKFNEMKPDNKLWHRGRMNMWNKLKEALFGSKEDVKKALDEAKDDVRKAAEDAVEAGKELVDDAADAASKA